MCLWPGAVRVWFRGETRGVVVAVGFAGLLNGCMLGTWVWPELVAANVWPVTWLMLAAGWLVSVWDNRRVAAAQRIQARTTGSGGDQLADSLFREAQCEYLKGNWAAAQAILTRLVRHDKRDISARLLWASVLARAGHLAKSLEQLRLAERMDEQGLWRAEIEELRRRWSAERDSAGESVAAQTAPRGAAQAA
jgi:hypothetical protein